MIKALFEFVMKKKVQFRNMRLKNCGYKTAFYK